MAASQGPLPGPSPLLCCLEAVDLSKHIFDLVLQLLWGGGRGEGGEVESGGGAWDRKGFTTPPPPKHSHSHFQA